MTGTLRDMDHMGLMDMFYWDGIGLNHAHISRMSHSRLSAASFSRASGAT